MLGELIARARSLWRGVRRGDALHAEMDEEFRLHQELRAADLVRQGLAPAEAARRARLEFGSTERYKHEGRASRGLRPFDSFRVSWLDVKLGFRMLVKYPGLTIVGGLALAFAIWVGAGTFEIVTQVIRPSLPLPDGDRIVGLQLWDAERSRQEQQIGYDFERWRDELRTVRDLGAFRTVERNLIGGEGRGEPIDIAEVSASAFRVARVAPLLGRALVEGDEQPGAPPVVVLGHDVWRMRFAGDSGVVGSVVRLGSTRSTVVGVMPEVFGFPFSHGVWAPLQLDAAQIQPRQGPGLQLFGRLAPGASLEEAQAELAALGRRAAADFPDTHEHLRPRVLPYAQSLLDLSGAQSLGVASLNLPVVMLLVLVCGNVALLLFARAATRESEIAVRNALGASRGRIVMQLFAEALVLGALAAAVGLSAAGFGLRWLFRVVEGELLDGNPLPFWFSDRLSPTTLLYAVLLTLLAAAIAGVLPGLKVTRGVGARLRQAAAGGGGLRFGGVWTAVIVSQIAVTIAFPVLAFETKRSARQIETLDPGFASSQFLSARLEMDREPPPGAPGDTSRAAFQQRFGATYEELARRIAADPAVAGVTFGDRLPRMYHPFRLVQADEGGSEPVDPRWPGGHRVSAASVEPAFFDVLGVPIVSGRGFHSGDLAPDARTIIVNQSFASRVFGSRNPIGRRVRLVEIEEEDGPRPADEQPWYEIVGVVRDLGLATADNPKRAGYYHPATAGSTSPLTVALHVRGDPAAFAPRLRALVTETDPSLRLYDAQPVDAVTQAELAYYDFWFKLLVVVSVIAMTLSLAGIYAVMSFTVARRTREIGIRVALGANPRRVAGAIFRRPLIQVTLGVVAGGTLIGAMFALGSGGVPAARVLLALFGYTVVMFGVCLLACIVPTRRALRVEPTDALRADD